MCKCACNAALARCAQCSQSRNENVIWIWTSPKKANTSNVLKEKNFTFFCNIYIGRLHVKVHKKKITQ